MALMAALLAIVLLKPEMRKRAAVPGTA